MMLRRGLRYQQVTHAHMRPYTRRLLMIRRSNCVMMLLIKEVLRRLGPTEC